MVGAEKEVQKLTVMRTDENVWKIGSLKSQIKEEWPMEKVGVGDGEEDGPGIWVYKEKCT